MKITSPFSNQSPQKEVRHVVDSREFQSRTEITTLRFLFNFYRSFLDQEAFKRKFDFLSSTQKKLVSEFLIKA